MSFQGLISDYYPKHYLVRECNNIVSIINELKTINANISVVYDTQLNATMISDNNKIMLVKNNIACSKKVNALINESRFDFKEKIWINKSDNKFLISDYDG